LALAGESSHQSGNYGVEQIIGAGAADLAQGGVEVGGEAAQQLAADAQAGAGLLGVLQRPAVVQQTEAQLRMGLADALLQRGIEAEDGVHLADLGTDAPGLLAQPLAEDALVAVAGGLVVVRPDGLAAGDGKDRGAARPGPRRTRFSLQPPSKSGPRLCFLRSEASGC